MKLKFFWKNSFWSFWAKRSPKWVQNGVSTFIKNHCVEIFRFFTRTYRIKESYNWLNASFWGGEGGRSFTWVLGHKKAQNETNKWFNKSMHEICLIFAWVCNSKKAENWVTFFGKILIMRFLRQKDSEMGFSLANSSKAYL